MNLRIMDDDRTPVAEKYATLKTDAERIAFMKKVLDAAIAGDAARPERDTDPNPADRDKDVPFNILPWSVRVLQAWRRNLNKHQVVDRNEVAYIDRVMTDIAPLFENGRVDRSIKRTRVMSHVMEAIKGGRRKTRKSKSKGRKTLRRR